MSPRQSSFLAKIIQTFGLTQDATIAERYAKVLAVVIIAISLVLIFSMLRGEPIDEKYYENQSAASFTN